MAGSSLLFRGSIIGFHARLELLPRTESHDATRADRNLLAGLGVSARPLVLVAQVEVAEAGEFYLAAIGERTTHFLEEQIHQFARFAFVEAELVEQRFRDFSLRQRHRQLRTFASSSRLSPAATEAIRASASASVRVLLLS